jgi:hypothetical protein
VSTRADNDVTDSELRRYAFHMEPQTEEREESWTAAYPGANWSASGRSRAEALQRLGEEFMQRQNAGEDPLAYAEGVYRRHLREPVEGVYAVDNELYRELVHAPAPERQRAIEEAERRRRRGQPYTLADYLHDWPDPPT